jgi:hypothetical protein
VALPVMLWLDTELLIIHTDQNCPGATIPAKYHYLDSIYVTTVEQARQLDEKYRACDRCKKVTTEERTPKRGFRKWQPGKRQS